ncbi:uncharacterized protein BKA78DRAFT_118291 [Phyllosticta capitalensis]|uniref:uncharacterized protein n=1 Tax=Phyllosticta capitalensis TaxID=121624 RepID=UPI00312F571B
MGSVASVYLLSVAVRGTSFVSRGSVSRGQSPLCVLHTISGFCAPACCTPLFCVSPCCGPHATSGPLTATRHDKRKQAALWLARAVSVASIRSVAHSSLVAQCGLESCAQEPQLFRSHAIGATRLARLCLH